MPTSKIRNAIMASIAERTRTFNTEIFPQAGESMTPEQAAIFEFLNGESGGITAIHESHRPEITRTLARIAGIEDMKSRFTVTSYVEVPPYTIIVPRESMSGYAGGFPMLRGRIQGYWVENGTGSSNEITPRVRDLRPVTEDDINKFCKKFPDNRLTHLYGAIKLPEKKLRKALAENITARTAELAKMLEIKYPDGITDKGKAILDLGIEGPYLQAMSIIIDDPAMCEEVTRPPVAINYPPFVAVVQLKDTIGSSYTCNRVHVQMGDTGDIFFAWPGEVSGDIGNHAEKRTAHIRPATSDEITDYFKDWPADRLHHYVMALSEAEIESLL